MPKRDSAARVGATAAAARRAGAKQARVAAAKVRAARLAAAAAVLAPVRAAPQRKGAPKRLRRNVAEEDAFARKHLHAEEAASDDDASLGRREEVERQVTSCRLARRAAWTPPAWALPVRPAVT